MMPDDFKLARICETLVSSVGLHALWENGAPTEKNIRLMKRRGGTLSAGEQLMLRVAWDFWNGALSASLNECIARLGSEKVLLIGEALCAIAIGAGAVDDFLRVHGPASTAAEVPLQ